MKPTYKKEGQLQGTVGAIVGLIIGVGVAVLVLIFVGALGGQTYSLIEDDMFTNTTVINATWDGSYGISNATVRGHIQGGIISGFEALESTGSYLPIIVLAVVITLVLSLVLSFGGISRGGGGSGRGAL